MITHFRTAQRHGARPRDRRDVEQELHAVRSACDPDREWQICEVRQRYRDSEQHQVRVAFKERDGPQNADYGVPARLCMAAPIRLATASRWLRSRATPSGVPRDACNACSKGRVDPYVVRGTHRIDGAEVLVADGVMPGRHRALYLIP